MWIYIFSFAVVLASSKVNNCASGTGSYIAIAIWFCVSIAIQLSTAANSCMFGVCQFVTSCSKPGFNLLIWSLHFLSDVYRLLKR